MRREDAETLKYDWSWSARPEQLPPPGEWRVWLLLAGRGFGKTRTGAELVRSRVARGIARRVALVGPTAADVRDVMVEGESGLLAIAAPDDRPLYEPSKRRLSWNNGAVATLFSADEPERLRGPQHDFAWCDELAAWRYPAAWDMLMFGLRLGGDPRVVVTTTPRPTKLIRALLADPKVAVTRGRTAENQANLAPAFLAQIVSRYEGTRLGRQELDGELLEDTPGALWQRQLIEAARVAGLPQLSRVVIAIDPAAASGEQSDETGIVVAGRTADGHGYVLGDVSGRYPPAEWARTAIAALGAHAADRIVAEVNNGGEMVEATLRMVDPSVPFRAVRASRGKVARAEPVAALYEQGRVHHFGAFPQLEDQMCSFTADFDRATAGYSPDRVDALVWALTELLVETHAGEGIFEVYRRRAAEERGVETLSRNAGEGDQARSVWWVRVAVATLSADLTPLRPAVGATPGIESGQVLSRSAGEKIKLRRTGLNWSKRGSMTLLVKDANTAVQSLATESDGSGNLVPVHAPAVTNTQGVATPVGSQNPLPVINTAAVAASDGSGTIATGGSAQALFGGIVPVNGFQVQNNSNAALWVSDVGVASAGGASVQVAASGGMFVTPSGYKPAGAVSLFGGTTGQVFAARRW